jgi:pimeloyl-ACP methyl ester carboxylesterase
LLALAPFARAESGLAIRLRSLAQSAERAPVGRTFREVIWSAAFGWLADKHALHLAPEQQAAVRMALSAPVSILTGGPGTGKTHSLRALLTLAQAKRLHCLLAAPTGRAAKRMEEATGLIGRAQAAVADLPSEIVFAGFSMGTGAAEFLAATRPGARAAILMHGAFAPVEFGLEAWPAVPVQVHYAENDSRVEVDQIRAFEATVRAAGAPAEVYAYDRGGHLFEDAGWQGHAPEAAQLMLERVLAFLGRL